MGSVTTEALLILLLILANGVFAMSEMAVVSSRKPRLQQRAEDGDAAAAGALALANEPGDFLSAVQIGITLIGILAGAFGGASVTDALTLALSRVPWFAAYSRTIALAVVVSAITFLSLVIGELVPKQLALNDPERIAALVARPMRLLTRLTSPLVRLLGATTGLVIRLLRVRHPEEPPVTEEEIRLMLAQGTEAGVFAPAEEDLVAGVFRLSDLRAAGLMTPRTEIEWLDVEDRPEELQRKVAASTYSRFPVAAGSVDEVLGVVHTRDLLARCLTAQPFDLQAAMRLPIFVPESTTALQLLDTFRDTGESIALVIDEYGGMQGLVTVTDIMEAVVGEMGFLGEPAASKLVARDDGSWLADGLIGVDEFKEAFHIDELPGEAQGGYQTLGGFVMTQLGRIPVVADRFEAGGLRFEVVDMDGRRVDKVLVRPADEE